MARSGLDTDCPSSALADTPTQLGTGNPCANGRSRDARDTPRALWNSLSLFLYNIHSLGGVYSLEGKSPLWCLSVEASANPPSTALAGPDSRRSSLNGVGRAFADRSARGLDRERERERERGREREDWALDTQIKTWNTHATAHRSRALCGARRRSRGARNRVAFLKSPLSRDRDIYWRERFLSRRRLCAIAGGKGKRPGAWQEVFDHYGGDDARTPTPVMEGLDPETIVYVWLAPSWGWAKARVNRAQLDDERGLDARARPLVVTGRRGLGDVLPKPRTRSRRAPTPRSRVPQAGSTSPSHRTRRTNCGAF